MMKKTIAILLAVLLLAAMLSGCGAKSQASAETVSITVVYADESTEEFELSCEHSTLADAHTTHRAHLHRAWSMNLTRTIH